MVNKLSIRFYTEYIEPCKRIFDHQGTLPGTLKFMEWLESHGDCPSLATNKDDRDLEMDELYSVRHILAQVSLAEHTFQVAGRLLELTKNIYQEHEIMGPGVIIMALGHDIGKIPILRKGLDANTPHSVISVQIVRDIFAGSSLTCPPIVMENVIQAIQHHHSLPRNPWDDLLKQADGLARELEIAEISRDVSIKPWDKWFNVREYAALLDPHINIIQESYKVNKWGAVSKGLTVYFRPSLLIEMARALATRHKIVDIVLIRAADKEAAFRKAIAKQSKIHGKIEALSGKHSHDDRYIILPRIVNSLRQEGFVADELLEGVPVRKYQVRWEKPENKESSTRIMVFVPLRTLAFGKQSDLDKRKWTRNNYLKRITDIIPLNKEGSPIWRPQPKD